MPALTLAISRTLTALFNTKDKNNDEILDLQTLANFIKDAADGDFVKFGEGGGFLAKVRSSRLFPLVSYTHTLGIYWR